MARTWVIATGALLLGLAGGYWFGRRDASGPPPAVMNSARPTTAAATPSRLAERRSAAPKAGQIPGVTGDAIPLLRLLQDMQKKGLLNFGVQVLDGRGQLSPAIRDLLKISATEAATLDRALATARQQLGDFEASVASAHRNPETGQLVITVPTFPELDGKVYDDVMAQFRDVLGPERNNVLLELAQNQIDSHLNWLGLETRSITIEHQTDDAGHDFISVVDHRAVTTGLGNGRVTEGFTSEGRSHLLDRNQVVQMLGPLGAKWVPPDL